MNSTLQQVQQAVAQLQSGNIAAARATYESLATQAGDDLRLSLELARLALHLGNSDQALRHLQLIIEGEPTDVDILVGTSLCLGELNQHDQGIEVAHRATNLYPDNTEAHSALGSLLTEAGNTDAAQRQFEHMIANGMNLRLAYTNLARLRKFSQDDDGIIQKAEALLQSGLPPRERLAVNFALGKIYDDCANYEKAFAQFKQANLLQQEGFDIAGDLNWFNQITSVFTASNIARLSELGNSSTQPVFIVGMPRSGTTLMERIIASHSKGAGAGELLAMPQIAHQIVHENESRTPQRALKRMTAYHMAEYAEHYLQTLRLGRREAARIVDKLPGNYQNLGLIATLFPNARIIHAVRHPLDTCLSCYFQAFDQVRWSNELESIAAMYKLYQDYMAHWKSVLPRHQILDVHYESLVEDPPTEGRRMLEHCGLTWEADSLEFHQQQAVVRTVSHAQVRQPIYQTSKMRWVNYADQLQELVTELSEYLRDDKETLAKYGLVLKKKKRFGLF